MFEASQIEIEASTFQSNEFVDVSSCVTKIRIHRSFWNNVDVKRQVSGWPDNVSPKDFCLFSVPTGGNDLREQVHTRMGRGRTEIQLPLPGSSLSSKLSDENVRTKPGLIGIFDNQTGLFYTSIGTKGNGPTAEEMLRIKGKIPGADYRKEKAEPWGLLAESTAREIEQATLDSLAAMGFRVGRIPLIFTLDGKLLANIVDPLYESVGVGETYSVARELTKSNWDPAIIARLTGGVRADVMATSTANPRLIEEPLYGFSSEIARRGKQSFIEYYHLPKEMIPSVDAIEGYDFSQRLDSDLALHYLKMVSFLMWRNYHLQDEYNQRFPLRARGVKGMLGRPLTDAGGKAIGPIWLNYKPGDWDIGGFMFDVDVFLIKAKLALEKGVEKERRNDATVLDAGLSYLGERLASICSNKWSSAIDFGKNSAQPVTRNAGFLSLNVRKNSFYSEDL